ncbi:hypothetical protein MESS4_330200 [Mesorhizobium sp. STM 4661]|nr:hypothetical protein MESS4_330200 [Mesorhizobium sp. STM 4661]
MRLFLKCTLGFSDLTHSEIGDDVFDVVGILKARESHFVRRHLRLGVGQIFRQVRLVPYEARRTRIVHGFRIRIVWGGPRCPTHNTFQARADFVRVGISIVAGGALFEDRLAALDILGLGDRRQ